MKLTDYELHEMYDAFLDEVYPETTIAGLTYQTSRCLKEIDPTAYRCGFSDWLDAEISDGRIYERDNEYFDEEPEDESEENEE